MHMLSMEEKEFLPHTTACCLDRTGFVSAFQGRILEKQSQLWFAIFRRKAGCQPLAVEVCHFLVSFISREQCFCTYMTNWSAHLGCVHHAAIQASRGIWVPGHLNASSLPVL